MSWIECQKTPSETVTLCEAINQAILAARAVVDAGRDSTEFKGREHGAVVLLHEAAGAQPLAEPENGDAALKPIASSLLAAIHDAHRRLGAPGNWGYGTPEGDSLRWLYDSTRLLANAVRRFDAQFVTAGPHPSLTPHVGE